MLCCQLSKLCCVMFCRVVRQIKRFQLYMHLHFAQLMCDNMLMCSAQSKLILHCTLWTTKAHFQLIRQIAYYRYGHFVITLLTCKSVCSIIALVVGDHRFTCRLCSYFVVIVLIVVVVIVVISGILFCTKWMLAHFLNPKHQLFLFSLRAICCVSCILLLSSFTYTL